MVALQLCVTDWSLGMGVKGTERATKSKSTGVMKGGGAAWKHREETALRPDSVTENKDNLFPSHSITVHCTVHRKTVLEGVTQ